MTKEGVLTKSIRGGKWLTLGYLIQKLIGIFSFLVLARLLEPSDFGVIAIILIIPKFLEAATDTGFGASIVQREGDIEKFLNPIWTIGIVKSLLIAGLIFLFGPLIASFFHLEQAVFAIRLGGLFILIQNLANIGEIFFFKELDFKKVFIRNTSRELSYSLTALALVVFWHSYWILVIATLVAYTTQAVSTYILHPYRPKLSFRFKNLIGLISYGKWIVSQRWLNQFYNLLENTTVARITSVESVGFYSKAKSVGGMIPVFLSSTLGIISFPAYSKIQEEKDKIKEGFIRSLDVLFFFTVPIIILLFAAGGRLITIFLGENWLPMLGALQILVIFFTLNGVNELSVSVFNAVDRPKKQASFSAVRFFSTALIIIPLTFKFGILGAAVSLLAGSTILIALNIVSLKNMSLVSLRKALGSLTLPAAIAIIFLALATFWRQGVAVLPAPIFIALIALSGLVYLGLIYLAGQWYNYGPYQTIKLILKNILER